jgi:hypothetical protein
LLMSTSVLLMAHAAIGDSEALQLPPIVLLTYATYGGGLAVSPLTRRTLRLYAFDAGRRIGAWM